MSTDEIIENKDGLEANVPVVCDDIDEQLHTATGSTDEQGQESDKTDSEDTASSPSSDPLPDTNGDELSEAPVESDQDLDSNSTDTREDGESVDDVSDTADAVQADDDADDADDGSIAGVEAESDSDTQPDDETADDSETESDAIDNEHDETEPCDEPCNDQTDDGDTDTVDETESVKDDTSDGIDTDIDTDTDDSETIGDVVTDSDMRVTVSTDLSNIDKACEKPVSLRDSIHSEYDDIDRKSRVPRAVKVAAGAIAAVAAAAALVTSTVAVMVVEIHPSVIGGETIASQQAGGIDGSGKKISASYTVSDALHSSNFDNPPDGSEILSWTDCWYTVAPGAESVIAEIESAGKGSRIDLSDGTSIDVDGRYASKAGSFDAGIDIEGIAKLYGGDDGWVAIRYDASHVLVGKRVAGGASEGE